MQLLVQVPRISHRLLVRELGPQINLLLLELGPRTNHQLRVLDFQTNLQLGLVLELLQN